VNPEAAGFFAGRKPARVGIALTIIRDAALYLRADLKASLPRMWVKLAFIVFLTVYRIAHCGGMAMARAPKLTTKLIHLRDAVDALSICKRTFKRRWHEYFTDPRCKEDVERRIERKVYEDELVVFIENGAGTKAAAAVMAYRKQVGRLAPSISTEFRRSALSRYS
jgi:siroheme synthase (precorrin-2 oxidase/ferrochelatase)